MFIIILGLTRQKIASPDFAWGSDFLMGRLQKDYDIGGK